MSPRFLILLFVGLFFVPVCLAKRHNKHGGGNKLIELLTAGIVAKVLQKNDDDGGGGGQDFYPLHIPLPMGTQAKHHHVTEKIIPIPIPHHTTRIIHINAGSHGGGFDQLGGGGGGGFDHLGGGGGGGFDHHGGGGGGGFDHHGGGGFDHHGGGDGGDGGYDDHRGNEIGPNSNAGQSLNGPSGDHHDNPRNNQAPTIQQLLFHDGGVYGMPQPPRSPHHPHHPHHSHHPIHPHHPHAMHMRRPMVSMVGPRYPGMPMPGMMPPMRPVPHHIHPATAAAQSQMVRVRHYYALPSARHRLLAHPQAHQQLLRQQQLQRYQQLLMLQQQRYPRPW